jgi:hypothetical protein
LSYSQKDRGYYISEINDQKNDKEYIREMKKVQKKKKDRKIGVLTVVFLIIAIIITAVIVQYTDLLPSKGFLNVTIKNELDRDLTYELYIHGSLKENKIIGPFMEDEFGFELEEGEHAVILIVDFGYGKKLARERPVISPEDTENISFSIFEFEIRH